MDSQIYKIQMKYFKLIWFKFYASSRNFFIKNFFDSLFLIQPIKYMIEKLAGDQTT
jgi:hypothetical protein